MMKGIDVSHYQGNIDWEKVAASGIEFAFIKATDGATGTDAKFAENRAGAKAAGLRVGFYHYFHPTQDTNAQANHFTNAIGALAENEFGVAVDLEETPPKGPDTWLNYTRDERVEKVSKWLELVDSHFGRRSFIYTTYTWFDGTLTNADFSGHPLWIAEYGVQNPKKCGAWQSYTIWQNSKIGQIEGIAGDVDLDVWPNPPQPNP